MVRKNKLNIKIRRFRKKIIHFLKTRKIFIILFIIFIFFLVGIKLAYNKYVNNSENIVKNIYFNKNIVNNPNYMDIIKTTNDIFSWINTAKNKLLDYKEERNKLLKNYWFLKKINIEVLSKDSLKINFKFKKPKILFIGSGEVFPVYKNNFIWRFNSNYISWLNLDTKTKIYLPSYIKTDNNLKGIFWKNNSDKIKKYIDKILKKYPKWKLFYIVWWENIKLVLNNKTIYFSFDKDIEKQINQLKLVENFITKDIKTIDVWNLNNWVYLGWK